MSKLLSVLIPAYNEAPTIHLILDKVINAKLPEGWQKEIVVVDDCSTDGTFETLNSFFEKQKEIPHNIFKQQKNQGKGAALHKAIELAKGSYLIVQDADLEYDPNEYELLLKPVIEADADVVYGSRFMGFQPHRILFFWHSIGNKFLTFLSNMFTNLNLTDMETCYKLMRTSYAKSFKLKEKRFGFEPEITAKLSKIKGIRIYEVGISYYGRTYAEGKKINWQDGLKALYCIVRYNLFK